jgi:hypothetical protein
MSELQSRGLSPAAAAAVLDSGLSLRLSLWVRASGGAGSSGNRGRRRRGSSGGGGCCGGGGGGGGGARDGGADESLDRYSVGSGGSLSSGSSSSSSSYDATAGGSSSSSSGHPGACAATADTAFGLMLDDGSSDLRSFGCFVRRSSSYQFYSGKQPIETNAGWQRREHVVSPCPVGFRRAVVLLRGRGPPAVATVACGSSGGSSGGGEGVPAVRFGSVELSFLPEYEPE